MARWTPLLRGDEFNAASRIEAEFDAMAKYGAKLVRCVSTIELEMEQEEMQARKRSRKPPDG
jgi:hypothetical protein